jgi:hypothetical protein
MIATIKRAKKLKSESIRSASASPRPMQSSDSLWDRISSKAYELWEQRGRQEGAALRDWLDAEEIVMEEIHEARE